MRKRTAPLCAAALVLGVLAAPASAELKYTMKIEARPSTVASSAPANPLLAALSATVVGAMAPVGGLELTVTVGEQGTRVDYPKDYLVVPAGGSTIVLPDGAMIVIDPASKTYWRMAKPALAQAAVTPKVTVTRTGQFDTIAGVRAERATFEIRVPLPPAAAQAGLPAETTMTGEAWFSEQYQTYTRLAAGLVGSGSLGFDALASEGFVMRSILRGELLGNQEVESIVTTAAEVNEPASSFEAPADFTEVAPPQQLPR